jgi:hypothetical protein
LVPFLPLSTSTIWIAAAIDDRLLEHRREALFNALKVIDHVYLNEPLGQNGHVSNPHQWDIQLARDADNQMRIYCQFPETFTSFRAALGLHNPSVQRSNGVSLKALDGFRKQVARELKLAEPVGFNQDMVWIENLAGASSEPKTTP